MPPSRGDIPEHWPVVSRARPGAPELVQKLTDQDRHREECDYRPDDAFTLDLAIKHDWAPDGKHLLVVTNANFFDPTDSANIATMRPDGEPTSIT
jgi:hypothetical protein